MARIPYVTRETIPEGRADLYDRLLAERGNPEHIFLALANAPDLTEAVLGMAGALRKRTALPKPFRELAVVTVGLAADANYEVEHHRNAALAAGVRREQLDQLGDFDTAGCFTEQERAVIRLAREVTVGGRASDTTWAALDFLGDRQRLELLLTIAWYNCVVRIILPLEIELEPWFAAQ
ncbi:MAG TPA: carboxymuconolactone decarboxylase family protein [Devosiaceae bacterium]|jgi:alkylhydroperoxidase family enzyme|nr:carboxymuconolactone decarboxylase family protein [Devosiaceae bacterium]